MATFTYIAKRPDGAETRGTITAANTDAAREELRKQGLMIEDLTIVPNTQPNKPQQQPRPAQPKPQQNQPRTAQQQAKPQQPKPAQQQPKPVPAPPVVQVADAPKATKPTVSAPAAAKPTTLPWSGAQNGIAPKMPVNDGYAPLHETLRIFAGWLLAWYGLIYALGFLEESGKLPAIPFIHELFLSPLVLQFTFGTFLLLALSNVHRWIGKGILAGFFLGIVYAAGLAGFVMYG